MTRSRIRRSIRNTTKKLLLKKYTKENYPGLSRQKRKQLAKEEAVNGLTGSKKSLKTGRKAMRDD